MMRLTNYVKELLFRKIDIMDVKNLHKAIAKLRKIHTVDRHCPWLPKWVDLETVTTNLTS